MALLLCIDTATETATVGLCNGLEVVTSESSADQKNSAAFVQSAIKKIMETAGVLFENIDAVAVVNGPGSYTGLRVGLASAKGICYAAGKPLILLNTLDVMVKAAVEECKDEAALYCPMIDARRSEVFTAVYNYHLQTLLPPQPLIVDANSFGVWLNDKKIYFFGSGHNKCEKIFIHSNAFFVNIFYSLYRMNELAQAHYKLKNFGDVAYAQPFYVKDFYLPGR